MNDEHKSPAKYLLMSNHIINPFSRFELHSSKFLHVHGSRLAIDG